MSKREPQLKRHLIYFFFFIILNLLNERKCFGQQDNNSIIENFGVKISSGYSHSINGTDYKHLRTNVYSIEATLLYDLDLENHWKLFPFIGYSRVVLNASDFLYVRYKYNSFHAGSYVGYTCNHFIPIIGIVAKKIISVNLFYDSEKYDVTDSYTTIIYQAGFGVKYKIKKVSFGIEGWIGINNIDNFQGFNPKRLNEYLASFEYFPF